MDQSEQNLIERSKATTNDRKAWLKILNHFENKSYHSNLAVEANASLAKAHYSGKRKGFGMNKYYSIMSKAFNDLDVASTHNQDHKLSEAQKVQKFTHGLQDMEAIRCSRCCGRGGDCFEPYYNKNQTPAQGKCYESSIWKAMNQTLQTQVRTLNKQANWISDYTPSPGMFFNMNGGYTMTQTTIGAAYTGTPLPPPPIPDHIEVNPGSAGAPFGNRGNICLVGDKPSVTGTIASVLIN